MKKIKFIIFWSVGLLFLINRFIRYFVNSDWGDNVRAITESLPLVAKLFLITLTIAILIGSYPYKKLSKK